MFRISGSGVHDGPDWTFKITGIRSRAAVPRWAALLAVVLEDATAEALLLMLGDTQLGCHQVLGVPYGADMAAVRQAMRGLALLYHLDKGGRPEQMVAVNTAYAEAAEAASRASQQAE